MDPAISALSTMYNMSVVVGSKWQHVTCRARALGYFAFAENYQQVAAVEVTIASAFLVEVAAALMVTNAIIVEMQTSTNKGSECTNMTNNKGLLRIQDSNISST